MLTFKGLKGLKGLYTNLDRRVTLYSAITKIKLKFYYSNNVIETIKSKVCFFSKRKGEVIGSQSRQGAYTNSLAIKTMTIHHISPHMIRKPVAKYDLIKRFAEVKGKVNEQIKTQVQSISSRCLRYLWCTFGENKSTTTTKKLWRVLR